MKIHNRHQYSKALVQLARLEEQEQEDGQFNRVQLTQEIMDLTRAIRAYKLGQQPGGDV